MPGEVAAAADSRPLTFFLSGFYGQGNLGDDLLLRATIGGLLRIAPVRRFVIRNENDISGIKDLPVPVVLTGIDKIASDQTKSKLHRLVSTLIAYRRHFMECDWFVFGGGTVFHERSSVGPLFLTFLVCLLARAMRVRIAALGVGIATLHSATGRTLLRFIISMSDVFAVRDDAAMAECIKAGAGNRGVLTGDLVFDLWPQLRVAAQRHDADSPLIGITVHPPSLLSTGANGDLTALMGTAIQTILARGWRIVLLAFHHQEGSAARLDTVVLAQLAASLPDEYQAQVTKKILRADDIKDIDDVFSSIDVHCGMRFHGHVLSAIFGKQFVGISVDNKTDAICRLFQMPVLQVGQFAPDDIVRAIDLARESHIDPTQRATCEDNAKRNFSQLALCLSRAGAPA